jgi:methylenetetrahydrofolate--tRNA-(uracil-5-)-methyltransferase
MRRSPMCERAPFVLPRRPGPRLEWFKWRHGAVAYCWSVAQSFPAPFFRLGCRCAILVVGGMTSERVVVIGGGLAGAEAAWQAARNGLRVDLFEMRPGKMTPAHRTGDLAELVCSNSLGSNLSDRALGLLKGELRRLGSLVIDCADETAVPAGGALAVGREAFARLVTERVERHPSIQIVREEVREIPADRPLIIATGPLTSDALSAAIEGLTGEGYLSFHDAMAPIVTADSIARDKVFCSSRYDRGEGDYINCPMDEGQYLRFVEELVHADTVPLKDFERDQQFFEACLPVEEIARRGTDALAYGPLRPVGLVDSRSDRRPHAVVQLRQDDLAGTLYNLVGFQTNLRWGEQERIFRMIPGLEQAEFVRYGQMHRNTFVNGPALLEPSLQLERHGGIFIAGQITGSEGYVSAVAGGWLAGTNAARWAREQLLLAFPSSTMIGALFEYVSSAEAEDFQPMKPNLGLLPTLGHRVRGKRRRAQAYAQRALEDLDSYMAERSLQSAAEAV